MGPRLFSRGNGSMLHPLKPHWRASMGPRLFSRGNPARDMLRLPQRGFNGAATLQSRKCSCNLETCTGKSGFNGAATLQSRKLEGVILGMRR